MAARLEGLIHSSRCPFFPPSSEELRSAIKQNPSKIINRLTTVADTFHRITCRSCEAAPVSSSMSLRARSSDLVVPSDASSSTRDSGRWSHLLDARCPARVVHDYLLRFTSSNGARDVLNR